MTVTAAQKQTALHPLNNPGEWGPSVSCPLSDEQVAAYQKDVDSIAGLTRDNKSIIKLVWNGDRRYWREVCMHFKADGEPEEYVKRPIVLFRTHRDRHGKYLYDVPVPRWLLLTRIEPEQYADTWERDSKVWDPERNRFIQIKPPIPPQGGWYVWFMTVAEHDKWCCPFAAEEDRTCYGIYAAPGLALDNLRAARKGMEAANLPPETPFDSPDRLSRKLRERGVNDYVEQTMRRHHEDVSRFADTIPNPHLRQILRDDRDRDIEDLGKGVM